MFKQLRNKKGSVLVIAFGLAIIGLTTSAFVRGYGTEPVYNCPNTHVDGNCAHMKIKDL